MIQLETSFLILLRDNEKSLSYLSAILIPFLEKHTNPNQQGSLYRPL